MRDVSTAAKLGDANTCLAPEAFGVGGRVSSSNDIWHLGCVLCMFMAWLYNGPEGLKEFNSDRYSEEQGADWFFSSTAEKNHPSPNETEYWRKAVKRQEFDFFRLSLEVENWLDRLLELTTGRSEAANYSALVQFVKDDLLIVDPKNRPKIEIVCRKLDSIISQPIHIQNRTPVLQKAPSIGKPSVSGHPSPKIVTR